ncbi:aromatic ring-hydroxylating oxygenase subunit alpha [Rhizobium sp. RAF56]|uniref:aromatic ring-hydroxylating oxygenase subunit alpha n=1 Tax=Rhizobium sp. RAF56 TaxID=3233062 RepID=UPI003F97788E
MLAEQAPDFGHPFWIAASTDENAFKFEQQRLSTIWAFVGFTSDIPEDGDWFATTLGGRSIFVQRFESDIRAFENRCAHRFYPLRTQERGNGQIVCGFHHWRYNRDGQALGIPLCREMFDRIPREMGRRLEQLEVDHCGDLIFARFRGDGMESLREFLADGFALIEKLASPRDLPYRFSQEIRAHWKFSHHISLDDYHLVAVHPKSFGKSGYLKSANVQYHRFGRHSAFFHTAEKESFAETARACAAGRYNPRHYLIVNIFPNFLISFYQIRDIFGSPHWYASALRYRPMARDRTKVHSWVYPTAFDVVQKTASRLLRPFLDRIVPPIVAHAASKIMKEDNVICEGLQANAHQVDGEQLLGRHEQRIAWFEEAYAEALLTATQKAAV